MLIPAMDGHSAAQVPGPWPGVVYAGEKRITTWEMLLFRPQGRHSAGKICFPWTCSEVLFQQLFDLSWALTLFITLPGWWEHTGSWHALSVIANLSGSWKTIQLLSPHGFLILIGTNNTNWHRRKMLRKCRKLTYLQQWL